VKLNGLYGYINKKGEVAVDLKFKYATDFDNGFAYVKMPDGKTEIINTKGEIASELYGVNYEEVSSNEVFLNPEKQKYGIKDDSSKVVLSANYDGIYQVGPEVFLLEEDKKYGMYNSITSKLINPKYPYLTPQNEHECISYSDNESIQGIMDKNGESLIEVQKAEITNISPNLKVIVKDRYLNFGAVTTSGPPDIHTRVGRINIRRSENGLMLIKIEYYNEIESEVKYVLYDPQFKMKICEISEDIVDVGHNFLVTYSRESRFTQISNLYGKVIKTYDGDYIERNGTYIVLQNMLGEYYIADSKKAYLEQEGYSEIKLPVSNNHIVVKFKSGYGIVSLDGEVKTNLGYEDMSCINSGIVVAENNSKQVYLNTEGSAIYEAHMGELLNTFSEGYGLIEKSQ